MADLERSFFTGFALIGLIVIGAIWVLSPKSHSSPRRTAVVILKQPQVVCRSAESAKRMGESGIKARYIPLPRMLFHECKTVEPGTELTVEEIGRTVARVREKDALTAAFVSTDQLMANVPTVASK